MTIRPRRSLLYVPGSNARALEKAAHLPVDGIILDLEDSVAPEAKAEAREALAAALATRAFGSREVVVRINALETPWNPADVAMVAAAKPDAVLLPKVESDEDVIELGRDLARAGAPPNIAIWAMIETPLAALRPETVAIAREAEIANKLTCLVLGLNDLAKDLRVRSVPGRAPLVPFLSAALVAGRAYGLDVLDGVFNAFDDSVGFEAECIQARDFGLDGKTLIHPSQIEIANRIFAPTPREVAQARRVIEAFAAPENRTRGAIALDGRMVERLHAEAASRTVALAEAIAAQG